MTWAKLITRAGEWPSAKAALFRSAESRRKVHVRLLSSLKPGRSGRPARIKAKLELAAACTECHKAYRKPKRK